MPQSAQSRVNLEQAEIFDPEDLELEDFYNDILLFS